MQLIFFAILAIIIVVLLYKLNHDKQEMSTKTTITEPKITEEPKPTISTLSEVPETIIIRDVYPSDYYYDPFYNPFYNYNYYGYGYYPAYHHRRYNNYRPKHKPVNQHKKYSGKTSFKHKSK